MRAMVRPITKELLDIIGGIKSQIFYEKGDKETGRIANVYECHEAGYTFKKCIHYVNDKTTGKLSYYWVELYDENGKLLMEEKYIRMNNMGVYILL